MYVYAVTSQRLTKETWSPEDNKSYMEECDDSDLEPVMPSKDPSWELVSSAANRSSLFWTWRRPMKSWEKEEAAEDSY